MSYQTAFYASGKRGVFILVANFCRWSVSRRCLLVVLLGFTELLSFSQELPKVIPPSPEASALFKFQDYPLDYSTGLPQIAIPLYEVKSGSLTLPITLAYHSSGRKVSDETGPVGLGWTLQAGGMVSRTIYGKPDDERWNFPSPFRREAELSNELDFLYLAAVGHHPLYGYNPYYETQYDIFSFSASGISGKFILKDEDNVKSPEFIPYKPYQVEWHKTTTQYIVQYFDYITITDDKGIVYRFGKSLTDGLQYLEKSSEGVSSWLLTEIISADKTDTISFKYKPFKSEKVSVSQESQMLFQESLTRGALGADYNETFSENINRALYDMQRLTEIKFRQGKVIFNLDSKNCLISMQVKNKKGEIIKTIDFTRSQINTMSDGIKPVETLDEVVFKDKFSNAIDRYAFQYYRNATSAIDVRSRDLWGYFNGKTNSIGVIDMRPFTIAPSNNAPLTPFEIQMDFNKRAPSEGNILEGVLEKITYPAGGSTRFVYELNKFYDPQILAPRNGGGIRVGQIITDDNSGNLLYKTFKYGENESGYGFLNIIPSPTNISDYSIEYSTRYWNFIEGAGGPVSQGCFVQCTVSADILPVFNFIAEKPVIYSHVTEYHGTQANNLGKTIYRYDFDDRMTPVTIEGLFREGKYRLWRTSELREKTDFRAQVNGGSISYEPQKRITYNYNEIETDLVYGFHFKKKYVCMIPNEPISYRGMWNGGLTKNTGIDQYVAEEWLPALRAGGTRGPYDIDDWEVYKFGDYAISVGIKELSSVVETEIHNGSELTTTTNYVYNDRHLIKEVRKTNSVGQTLVTETKYPFDFASEPIYQQMISNNMLNFEVEVNTFRDQTPLASVKNSFKDWGNSIVEPEIVSTRTGTNAYEPRLTFHSYDLEGNIRSVSKDNGAKISYLYGYNDELPIAQVTNAAHNQIFHTSFEDNEGNSGENDAKTGRKSRTGGYSPTLTGLANGTYLLTYWQKNSGQWQFFEVKNISVSSGSYEMNLTGQVDEVRLYPQDAFMTTYTYDPLEGLLSTTDQNNITTYFEYDGYQRLMMSRDQHQNALRELNYHLKD